VSFQLSENGTDGKGTDSRLNYVVKADDLSQLAKLMNPNTPLTEEERSSLLAMAAKYNLHPEDPEFAKKIKSLTHSAITVKDSDVISDVLPQADGLRSQQAIREVLSSAGDDPAGLFSGSGAGLMAVGMGITLGMQRYKRHNNQEKNHAAFFLVHEKLEFQDQLRSQDGAWFEGQTETTYQLFEKSKLYTTHLEAEKCDIWVEYAYNL